MNKAIIFDWSGTLSDNFDCSYKACVLMFEALGKPPLTADEFRLNFTTPYMKFWNKYFPDLTKQRQNELYEKCIHQTGEAKMYPEARETVEYAHKEGFMLFIVSSDHLSKLLPEIEKSGLAKYFTEVVGNIHEKAGSIAGLVKKYELDPKRTFYVGDTSGDVEAGKAAGVKTIGITWGVQHKSILSAAKPDFLIDEIKEIKKIVSKN